MKVIDVVQDIAEVIELGNGKKLTASQFLDVYKRQRHICHFFGTFVNKQHDHVRFRMVGCYCVSDVFHQDRLTGRCV